MDRFAAYSFVFLLAGAHPAAAVIIDSGDGTGNTSAPSPDPGWSNVGLRGTWGAVYLGDGWVLTANHVGAGTVELDGISYPHLPSLVTQIKNGDGSTADLLVFGLASPHPPLPDVTLALTSPALGEPAILIGPGVNRGAATSWQPNPPLPQTIDGYDWGAGSAMRWGTNEISSSVAMLVLDTMAISTEFDETASAHECQAANGDSGGALFVDNGGAWELAGILFAVGTYLNQPAATSLYGNPTYAADIATYRDAILDVTSVPEPSGGLLAGLALLSALNSRAARRR